MTIIEWSGLLIALVLALDFLRSEYADWRERRLAIKNGRTLTAKFALPPLARGKCR